MLALAQYRAGRQEDALRTLDLARRTLVDQLGVDPGDELVALEAAILRQDPTLGGPGEPLPGTDTCPYKGLAPYEPADAENFFGRQAETAACLERLRSTPLLVVTGPSGCGKSSLVRAGLIPALVAMGRTAVVVTPDADPDTACTAAHATATDTTAPVLVVDQFEELFALGHPLDVVRAFVGRLTRYAVEEGPVVIVVRADHLGGLALDGTTSRLAEQGLHLVSPLAGDALREAIEQPAAQAGLRLQDGLVDLLIRDTDGEPGALPLLSHAFVETWRRRDGHVLTVEGYRATGGIRGAVARSAEQLYDSLPAEQRPLLRSVLMRLVADDRWRPGAMPGLHPKSARRLETARVVTLLVRSRLVTFEADTFELAHEALARAWPRLRSWLEEDAAGQRIMRHLSTAASGWESLGCLDSELYRGARLDTALEWRAASDPDLTTVERSFLESSVEHAASESHELTARARRDAQQNRRLRALLVGVAVLLVMSLAMGLLALLGRQDARQQRDAARSEQARAELSSRTAFARQLASAAAANLTVDAERSILLALAAIDATRSWDNSVLREAEESLHAAVAADRVVRGACRTPAARSTGTPMAHGSSLTEHRVPGPWSSATGPRATWSVPCRAMRATSQRRRSAPTVSCSPPPGPMARRGSGCPPRDRSCTR